MQASLIASRASCIMMTYKQQTLLVLCELMNKTREQVQVTRKKTQCVGRLNECSSALWRRAGWTNIADTIRATGASVAAALTFIGVA